MSPYGTTNARPQWVDVWYRQVRISTLSQKGKIKVIRIHFIDLISPKHSLFYLGMRGLTHSCLLMPIYIYIPIVRQSKTDLIHKQVIRPLRHGGSHFVMPIHKQVIRPLRHGGSRFVMPLALQNGCHGRRGRITCLWLSKFFDCLTIGTIHETMVVQMTWVWTFFSNDIYIYIYIYAFHRLKQFLTHSARVAHMWVSKLTITVQRMACRLAVAKPLSEPMLEYCQLDRWEQTSVKF